MVEWFFNYSTRRQCIVFFSSLIVLLEGNWLDWRQLFSGEILWWGDRFLGGQFPLWAIPRAAIIKVANIHGKIFLGSNCPRTQPNPTKIFYMLIKRHSKNSNWNSSSVFLSMFFLAGGEKWFCLNIWIFQEIYGEQFLE